MVTAPLLRAEALTQVYGRQNGFFAHADVTPPAVDRISLALYPNETLGLVGESGSGKSSLCRLLLRLEEPSSGTVWFREQRMMSANKPLLSEFRKNVQAVFQDPYDSLHPRMRVEQILAEPLVIFDSQMRRNERDERVALAMRQVGLDPTLASRYPAQFSGGQLQRICIARALMLKPSVLIADEPITALDVSIQAQIVNLLKDLQQQLRITYLFVSHDLNMVRYLCDRVAVMYRGRIVETGPVEAIFLDPRHSYTRALLSATPAPNPDAPLPLALAYTGTTFESPRSATLTEVDAGHFVLLDAKERRPA
ncbi:ATP-binding cassette domain-containing protein [Telmatobacter bradus]|uniref:ATP-binding cassette domain-containing protein n=1 Tax=Telmatobacter bradus TaxID=474953 RepID=UPI003B43A88D